MKVLHVTPSYYPATVYGGPVFSVHYACQALARQGVQINVSTTNANGGAKLDVPTWAPVAFGPNHLVHYYNDTIINRFSAALTLSLWRDIRTAQIVHLQNVFSAQAVWTLLLAGPAKKPVLLSPRGVLSPWGLAMKRPLLKRFRLAALVRPFVGNRQRVTWHATSELERKDILNIFSSGRVFVVPNGINREQFDEVGPPDRSAYLARFGPEFSVPSEKTQILAGLGRLHPTKGFDVAIKALKAICERFPHAVLLIAGRDNGEEARLRALIACLGLKDRVALVGEVRGEEKIAFLKGADVFLFPSHTENFGLALLEALTAGVPAIVSRKTPWAEVETEGAGLWADNTVEVFAGAIENMLTRDRDPMRERARALAARFDLDAIASTFQDIYLELINDTEWR